MTTYSKARSFICRNARPIDFARFKYHFEQGSKEDVLAILAAYQNPDGGFGFALEADAWNPNSTPIQTFSATEILREMDLTSGDHPIIQGILKYLESGRNFNGRVWSKIARSNNEYPHAPWWHSDIDSENDNDYNPTACLAGFIIRFARKDSDLYHLGCRIAKESVESFFEQEELSMHTLLCYIRLMEYCDEADAQDVIDINKLRQRLKEQVANCITADTAQWETDYICKPSQFFNSPDSIFYSDNRNIADYECDFIVRTQQEDGAWNITWSWSDYPEEWAVSRNWWKSYVAVSNLLYLKGMGRL